MAIPLSASDHVARRLYNVGWAKWSQEITGRACVHVARPTPGTGWQRVAGGGFNAQPPRIIKASASAASLDNKGRDDLSVGQRGMSATGEHPEA
jgi:hypothetical protein